MTDYKIEHFILKDGILEIKDDKLIIDDRAKTLRFMEIATGIFSLMYGVSTAFRAFKEHDNQLLFFGVAVSLFWIIALPYRTLRINSDTIIPLENISKIELKKGWFGKSRTGRIMLLNKKVRTFQIDDREIINEDLIERLKLKNLNIIV